MKLEFVLLNSRFFQKLPQHARSQRPISVDRDGQMLAVTRLGENVMTSVNARQIPAFALEEAGEILAADRLNTATSRIIASASGSVSALSTSSQPSIASRKFAVSSSSVSPCVRHPGSAGTSAQ